jgi:hypothetical protein
MLLVLFCSAAFAVAVENTLAAPPLMSLVPFRKVEADPLNWYELTEDNGPWVILAASFRGERATHQAHELVLELRTKHRLKAYLHARQFDFSNHEQGLGLTRDGRPKTMRYVNDDRVVEVAVLVGDFDSVGDPRAQRALETVKHARPECMQASARTTSNDRFAALRAAYQRITSDEERKQMGPMRAAFVTANPLLPKEFFVAAGLDPLVVSMNRDVTHSLLDCQGQYSVRVATFRGRSTMPLREKEIEKQENSAPTGSLVEAAAKAHKLTEALRARGVEAYEFHDVCESIVAIGSFNSIGDLRADGKTEINPAVHRIMQMYSAEPKQLFGDADAEMVPRSLEAQDGSRIQFDVQAVPIRAPKAPVMAGYAGRGLLR